MTLQLIKKAFGIIFEILAFKSLACLASKSFGAGFGAAFGAAFLAVIIYFGVLLANCSFSIGLLFLEFVLTF